MKRSVFPGCLSGNQLKIIAMFAMTIDHLGVQIFTQTLLFRLIGRLALPIFAYMIAEGCTYTRNRGRYLMLLAGSAAVCQAVYFFAMQSLYMCILVTFTMSVILIYALDFAMQKKCVWRFLVAIGAFAAVIFLTEGLGYFLPGTDYIVDYGIWGVLLPVAVYSGRTRAQKFILATLALCALAAELGGMQWYALYALPLLALYNGKRGKWRMKYVFYIYYPAHLAAIWFLSTLI